MHRLLVEVEVRFAISIRTQSLKRTRNGMRSSTRLVVTSNMQTHVRLSFQNENTIWSRPETVNLLESFDMRHEALVRGCARLDARTRMVIPIGKTLKFVSNSAWVALNLHSKLSTCTCQTHAELYQINYTETAFYNRKLARYILIAVKHASKKS